MTDIPKAMLWVLVISVWLARDSELLTGPPERQSPLRGLVGWQRLRLSIKGGIIRGLQN